MCIRDSDGVVGENDRVKIEQETSEALLDQAITVVLGLLPPGWSVERRQGQTQSDCLADEQFFLEDRDGLGRPILVDTRPRTTPGELDNVYNLSLIHIS